MPITLSPGLIKVKYAAMFAWEPEWAGHLHTRRRRPVFRPVPGKIFGDVHEFASAVVAFPGVALCIFVRQRRSIASRTAALTKFSDAMSSSFRVLPVDFVRIAA